MNDVVNLPAAAAPRREITQVVDAVPILDTARFEHMQRVANVLARSSMIPETLRTIGTRDNKQDLPFEQVLSNCFLVVNQATRWGMDPFAVISCCSVVHGRLSYEGKLVSAVLDAKLGIELHHHFTGNPGSDDFRIYLSDKPFTDDVIAALKPNVYPIGWRIMDGSVGEWKTAGAGTPWTQKNYRRMLIYRGTRDWARIYRPAIMLGVYSEDEMLDLVEDARARRATPIIPISQRIANTEVQREAAVKTLPPAPTGDEPLASNQEPLSNGSGAVQDRSESTAPTNSNSSQPLASSPIDAETDKPASDSLAPNPADAGNHSESSDGSPAADDGVQADAELDKPGVGLPAGWQGTYAQAMTRVSDKPKSLASRRTEALKLIGGTPSDADRAEMEAMEDLVKRRNSGDLSPDAFKAALREIVPDGVEI